MDLYQFLELGLRFSTFYTKTELFPLYTASSRENGGLGFSPNEIGSALAFSGVVTLLSQIFVLPFLTRKYGLLRLFQMVLFILVFLYMSQGIIRVLYEVPDLNGRVDTKFWVWVGVLTSLAIKTICHTICFTGCTILVNNACPRVESLGAVNGFSQCKVAFVRLFVYIMHVILLNLISYLFRLRKCYACYWSCYLWCNLVCVSTFGCHEDYKRWHLLIFLIL